MKSVLATGLAVALAVSACSTELSTDQSDAVDSTAPAASSIGRTSPSVASGTIPGDIDLSPVGIADAAGRMVDCMAAQGFVGTIESDGGIRFDYTPDQTDQFIEAQELCTAEALGFDPSAVAAPTDSQLAVYYDRLLVNGQCLEGLGYEVPTPPSLEVFLESGGLSWHPYMAFGPDGLNPSDAEWEVINETCPQPSVWEP